MEKTTMRTSIEMGKIAYNGSRKINAVTIDIELRRCGGEETFTIDPKTREKKPTGNYTPEYIELSICGNVWNICRTDIVCGGQCLDTIAEFKNQLNDPDLFEQIYALWKSYHLNGMHAGTPEQEAIINAWRDEGNHYDYTKACEVLKACGMYEVNFSGLTVGRRYNDEPYRYGHEWVINELPGEVLLKVEHLIDANNASLIF